MRDTTFPRCQQNSRLRQISCKGPALQRKALIPLPPLALTLPYLTLLSQPVSLFFRVADLTRGDLHWVSIFRTG